MDATPATSMDPGYRRRQRKALIPDAVLGMILFIIVEVMLFSGFISGYTIVRANAAGQVWPPPGQPRLPVESTAFNTLLLLISGVLVVYAARRFKQAPKSALWPFVGGVLLGLAFVGLQGMEWVALLGEGLTMTSSSYGSFFYMIVGAHALHAVIAILVMVVQAVQLTRGTLTDEAFTAGRLFWYFVVGLWPVLYWQVYLS